MAERQALEHSALLRARRDRAGAAAILWQALALEPNLPHVHNALATLRWPGPDFRHWLAWLHGQLRPALYLEIGVERGESLALARPPTRVVGVDPEPAADALARCTAPTTLYRQPSAEFLRAPPADSGLAAGFDLAFIDGDHRFEAVLDDFAAAERLAAPGALLVLHDTLPLTAPTAAAQRRSGFYSGDGWKLVPCLAALRPDLEVVTLPVAPTGLTLVAGLDPTSTVLHERRADIVAAYAPIDAQRVVERPQALLAMGLNEPAWVKQWLLGAGVRSRS